MAFKDTTERNAMNYYISDLHIGHENILRFDNRPFADVNEMNTARRTVTSSMSVA